MNKIAFIDSISSIIYNNVTYLKQDKNGNFISYYPPKCEKTHADCCLAIFLNTMVNAHNIFSLGICSNNYKAQINDLENALEWCLKNSIDVINISMGMTYMPQNDNVYEIIEKLISDNVIIVAACSNDNKYSFPSSLTNIIGVRGDLKRQLEEGAWCYARNDWINIDIMVHIPEKLADSAFSATCNSYACAYMSAIISDLYDRKIMNQSKLRKILLESSINFTVNPLLNFRRIETNKSVVLLLVEIDKFVENKIIDFFLKNNYNCLLLESYDENCYWINEQVFNMPMDDYAIDVLYTMYEPDICIISINYNAYKLKFKWDLAIRKNYNKLIVSYENNECECYGDNILVLLVNILKCS